MKYINTFIPKPIVDDLSAITKEHILKIPYNNACEQFVVLGRNINPNPSEVVGEVVDYDFVDVMSMDLLLPVGTVWKKENDKGTDQSSRENLTFIKSDIINELNSKLELFPKYVQDMIIPRKMRFSIGSDNAIGGRHDITMNVGKVWLPSVKEVTGNCYISDADPYSKQYPYFKDVKNRIFRAGCWWTCSANSFNDGTTYIIRTDGCSSLNYANTSYYGAPLCLRIKL